MTTPLSQDNPQEPEALPYAGPATPQPEHLDAGGISRRDVATIATRIIGFYLIASSIPGVMALVSSLFAMSPLSDRVRFIVPVAFFLGLGVVLVAFGHKLARFLLPTQPLQSPGPRPPMSVGELQSAAFAVLGIVLVTVWSLPSLAMDWWAWQYGDRPRDAMERADYYKPFLIRHALELVLGLWLFLGSKRLSGFWERLRSDRGTPPDERPL